MENLNMIKIVGLMVLLAIALALPAALPKTGEMQDGRVQVQQSAVQRTDMV